MRRIAPDPKRKVRERNTLVSGVPRLLCFGLRLARKWSVAAAPCYYSLKSQKFDLGYRRRAKGRLGASSLRRAHRSDTRSRIEAAAHWSLEPWLVRCRRSEPAASEGRKDAATIAGEKAVETLALPSWRSRMF